MSNVNIALPVGYTVGGGEEFKLVCLSPALASRLLQHYVNKMTYQECTALATYFGVENEDLTEEAGGRMKSSALPLPSLGKP